MSGVLVRWTMDYDRLREDLMSFYGTARSIYERISRMMDCELLAFAFDCGVDLRKYDDYSSLDENWF